MTDPIESTQLEATSQSPQPVASQQTSRTSESDWTPVRFTAGMLGKLAIVAVLLYLVISERGMDATFGLLVLLLGVWIGRDMVRLVIQRPKDPSAPYRAEDH